MEIRLQKFLAEAGIASRRKSEELIKQGLISVNDITVTQLGTKINSNTDIVKYKEKIIKLNVNYIYLMLNKPDGYVTTVKDQFDRPTILDIIQDVEERIYPIGRLDYDTEGLILLTNDGDLTYKLTHPKHNIDKTYIAKVVGIPSEKKLQNFRDGLLLDDNFKTSKAKIKILEHDKKYSYLEITIHEGKNRQVRRMCEAIGHKVVYLKRTAVGDLFIGNLKKGFYRSLTKKEISYLKNL